MALRLRLSTRAATATKTAARKPAPRRQAKAAPPEPSKLPVVLYGAVAAVIAAGGLAASVSPSLVLDNLTGLEGGASFLADNVLRSDAPYTLVTAACCGCLAYGNESEERLASATYERLELAVLLTAAAVLTTAGLGTLAFGVLSPSALAATAAVALPLVALTGTSLSKRGSNVASLLVGDLGTSLTFFSAPTLLAKYLYSNVPLSLIVGLSFAFSPMSPLAFPQSLLPVETTAYFLLRAWFGVPTIFILAPTYWLLADAAAREQLGAPVFKALLLTCGFATLGIDAATFALVGGILEATGQPLITGSGSDLVSSQAPTLISAIAIAASQSGIFFYQALKNEGVDEEVVERA